MSCYAEHVMPWLIDRGMRNKVMTSYRPRVPPMAEGRVLELGVGAGLNFPFYTTSVRHLFALEPADALRAAAGHAAEIAPFPVTFLGTGAEGIPLESATIDSVVSTWTLCSIADVSTALLEVRRVLRPGGRFLFLEHGRSPDPDVMRMQDRFAPVLRSVAGCNPNRQIDVLIETAGFRFEAIGRHYLDGPRFLAYHFEGVARHA